MPSTASMTSISAIHHPPLPSTKKPSQLLRPQATVVAEPPPSPSPVKHRRASYGIKLPTALSHLLHLSTARSSELAANPPPTPLPGRKSPTWSPKEDITSLRDELHGHADWSALLRPLHPWFRREVIKYGELAQATYDAFDANPFSPYCGSCLYNHGHLLSKLGLSARHGYTATKYIYATSHLDLPRWLERSLHADAWSHDSNWMGYVAVSDDAETRRIGRRDVVVAWRGTVAPSEWLEDLQGKLEPLGDGHGDARVEHGFLSLYTSKSEESRYNRASASEQVMGEVRRLVEVYKARGEEVGVTFTGHSLGGALALLSAYEAATAAELADVPVSVVSFGAPRVGNEAFGEAVEGAGVKVLRVVVKQDVVPMVPGLLFNEGMMVGEWVYTHVGMELGLDVKSSPYLKHNGMDLAGFHGLETYLHLVDGFVAAGAAGDGCFRRDAKRDPALVNKGSAMLRDELRVPACWNQAANKGMVCNAYGRWALPQRAAEDIPSPYRDAPAPPCFA